MGFKYADLGACGWSQFKEWVPQQIIQDIDNPEGEADRIRKGTEANGLQISELFIVDFGYAINHPDPEKRKDTRQLFTKMAKIAQKAGFESMMMTPGDVHDADHRRALQVGPRPVVGAVADVAAHADARLVGQRHVEAGVDGEVLGGHGLEPALPAPLDPVGRAEAARIEPVDDGQHVGERADPAVRLDAHLVPVARDHRGLGLGPRRGVVLVRLVVDGRQAHRHLHLADADAERRADREVDVQLLQHHLAARFDLLLELAELLLHVELQRRAGARVLDLELGPQRYTVGQADRRIEHQPFHVHRRPPCGVRVPVVRRVVDDAVAAHLETCGGLGSDRRGVGREALGVGGTRQKGEQEGGSHGRGRGERQATGPGERGDRP